MSNKVTTTGSLFSNNEDITHISKRTQQSNLLNAARQASADEEPDTELTSVGVPLPAFVTIEKAITYYHDAAQTKKGSEKTLYEQTEKWLKEYLTIKQTKQ